MTKVRGTVLVLPGFVGGLQQDPAEAPLGTISEGSNFVPLRTGRFAVRNGSRIVQTLVDGSSNELTHIPRIHAFSPVGMVPIGWSDTLNKHYAYRMTADGAFITGLQSSSRIDLTVAPSTSWNNTTTPARPMMAELWEKLFVVDATPTYASRNTFLSIDASGTVLQPTFSFDGGAAAVLRPFTCEEFNNVLFVAGYGDATVPDRPEMVRHSFLGKSPDAADGFNTDAWIMIGAKGQRVTAMCKGDNAMLVAKTNELYRVSGYGRAYAGWQYEVQKVQQTLGVGVYNPYAFVFAQGYWYGVGEAGPFRTDGVSVESLRGPREAAWGLVSNPEAFSVDYHPDRGLILFGVRQATGLPPGLYLSNGSVTTAPATYPNVLWAWDIAREVWSADLGFNQSFFHVRAIPTTTPQTPQGTPTALAGSSITATTYSGNWTNGDATCQTEYYEKSGVAGSYSLVSTAAAGVTTLARTGLVSHTRVFYYLQHLKAGVRSTASSEIEVKTLLAPPTLSTVQGIVDENTESGITVTITDTGTTLYVQESLDGVSGWSTVITQPSAVVGTYTYLAFSSVVLEGRWYRAYTEDLAWSPATSANSNVVNCPVRL